MSADPLPQPDGRDRFVHNLPGRHRASTIWRGLFLAATLVGIIALIVLLLNIINSAFGYVSLQNDVDPEALVLAVNEELMLNAPNTESSEDDTVLAEGVAGDPNAIGFFGYAYYQQNQDRLKALSVGGVAPSIETAEDGTYPLARPLYIYTSADVMQEKPQVAAFLNFYLSSINAKIQDIGYFPVSEQVVLDNTTAWLAANGLGTNNPLPPVDPAALEGNIVASGSSTVYPVTQRMADDFQAAGFSGSIAVGNVGSSTGLAAFCNGAADIANSSRPINRTEIEACRENGREPIGFRVGADALSIVANRANTFLNDFGLEQLRQVFTTAANWSEIDPAYPDAPIARFIPGADSGTLDFFVEGVFDLNLASLPKETLVEILRNNISAGLLRRFESEQPIAERSQEEIYALVQERVVSPQIVDTWTLLQSLTQREAIEARVAEIPNGTLEMRSWLTLGFAGRPQSDDPQLAGVRTAILGSVWTIAITVLFAFPIGVAAAIYLEEYARDSWINRAIQTNINNLAGVPSIIYGMLGLAIFVRALESITSGAAFGVGGGETTLNGRTILSAGLTLALLVLPVIIISAQEAIRAVPRSLRQASFGLGATKWQTVWSHVLPNALPGILTGTILAISRAIGETAPLVVVGASTFITFDPSGPFSKFTTLPAQIYQWSFRAQDEYRRLAAAAIVVLLILLLTLNAAAILLRNRFSTRRLT
ncbi:MAG TPA: phosphate ABC transporter permease PstA [Anaerolineae bacterium]|nr:phosphate ABC transporter permease PstA [Anaerolineae bacterium]